MRVVVLGAGGHAKVAIEVMERAGQVEIVALIDDGSYDLDRQMSGYPVLGGEIPTESLIEKEEVEGFFVAIGDNWTRYRIARQVNGSFPALNFVSAVDPSATIGTRVRIGRGSLIMPGAVVNVDCHIGCGCIVNTQASVDHDAILGDFASVQPGVLLGGNVRLGKRSCVGIGAVVLHGITIGEDTVIGGGAVVTESIPNDVVAIGVPARVQRTRAPEEPYL